MDLILDFTQEDGSSLGTYILCVCTLYMYMCLCKNNNFCVLCADMHILPFRTCTCIPPTCEQTHIHTHTHTYTHKSTIACEFVARLYVACRDAHNKISVSVAEAIEYVFSVVFSLAFSCFLRKNLAFLAVLY